MSDGSLKTLAMLALIIGAAGVGFGIFATWQVQRGGADGDDGDDGDDGITTIIITYDNVIEYPCSSEADINNALTAIGTGYGIITITNDITISQKIVIGGSGNYIIQGAGAIIKCGGDIKVFEINDAKSLTIQNIKINSSLITSNDKEIIHVKEINDNPICIKNVQIIGALNTKGRGISIDSDNVWISECYFHKVRYGVYQNLGQKAQIQNNKIDNCNYIGIYLNGEHNVIDGNLIDNCGSIGIFFNRDYNVIDGNLINNTIIGIKSDYAVPGAGYYNIISNNIIYGFTQEGIWVASNYTTVVGNNIGNTSASGPPFGIYVTGSYNTIDANVCHHITTGYGIMISTMLAISTNNTVVGNTCLLNKFSFSDVGAFNTCLYGNQFF